MNQGILDAFVTAVIAASDYEEMDRIYLKNHLSQPSLRQVTTKRWIGFI